MEGLAAASSVMAVASLAGQILQGCTYLRELFHNAIDAPRESRLLLNELAIIEEMVKHSATAPTHQQALNLCNERLSKVCEMMSKSVDVEKTGRCRKWGRQLAIALNSDLMQKHVSALREAKSYLEFVQNESTAKEILDRSYEMLESVEEVRIAQSDAASVVRRADRKLDDLQDTANETQRALHELADRFVLLDAKARLWARQNEQLVTSSIQKGIRDSFEQLLLPAVVSNPQTNQWLSSSFQEMHSDHLVNRSRLFSESGGIQKGVDDQTIWESEPRVIELPDHFSLQTSCWDQKDLPPDIERRSMDTTPMDWRFLRFKRVSSSARYTTCAA